MPNRVQRLLTVVTFTATLGSSLVFAETAKAEFEVCNNSSSTAYVAIGYNAGGDRWSSEGWWRIPKGRCETVVDSNLTAGDYYYLYASDEDENAVWSGDKDQLFCVKPEEDFKLTMTGDNCSGSGTARRTFWEIRVNGTSYTQNLVD